MIQVSMQGVRNPASIPETGLTIRHLAARTAQAAVRALLREAEAGPKPGLVDRFGPGVHTDMDISHFRMSAAALGPFFESITLESALAMVKTGQPGHGSHEGRPDGTTQSKPDGPTTDQIDGTFNPPVSLAHTLRQLGLLAESAMLTATGGVNTHKGAIWTLGLLCAAVGSLVGGGFGKAEAVCTQAARLAKAILAFQNAPVTNSPVNPGAGNSTNPYAVSGQRSGLTNGLAARQTFGLRSARDEALDGFPSIQALALPLARKLRNSRLSEDEKVISVLLAVMSKADDTCLVARGGLPALQLAQSTARQVLHAGGPGSGAGRILYRKMVADFKDQGLSPGGSADLCAATLFLADIEAGLSDFQIPAQALRL